MGRIGPQRDLKSQACGRVGHLPFPNCATFGQLRRGHPESIRSSPLSQFYAPSSSTQTTGPKIHDADAPKKLQEIRLSRRGLATLAGEYVGRPGKSPGSKEKRARSFEFA